MGKVLCLCLPGGVRVSRFFIAQVLPHGITKNVMLVCKTGSGDSTKVTCMHVGLLLNNYIYILILGKCQIKISSTYELCSQLI